CGRSWHRQTTQISASHCTNALAVASLGSSGNESSVGAITMTSTSSSVTTMTAKIIRRLQKSGSHGGASGTLAMGAGRSVRFTPVDATGVGGNTPTGTIVQ